MVIADNLSLLGTTLDPEVILDPKRNLMPSTSVCLSRSAVWPNIFHLMTAIPIKGCSSFSYDRDWSSCITGSFSYFMAKIHQVEPPPEAYGFTTFSAVPVSDAVRGYYEELGRSCPELIPIPVVDCHTTPFDKGSRLRKKEKELHKRVGRRLCKISSIAVIDQYVASGETVKFASDLCVAHGIGKVTKVSPTTRWYHNGYESRDPATYPDIENMTSPYFEIMFTIGRAAAQVVDTMGDELLRITVDT